MQKYIKLYKLVKKRSKSQKNYYEFESFQAETVIYFLESKKISLKNKLILDIACGRGGYSKEFQKKGARIISVDISKSNFKKDSNLNFILGNGKKLPFKKNTFDFVFSSSTIEHIDNQLLFIKELYRVLKKGKLCYLSFPPFWSPVGSHQFKPFHYFGEKNAIKLSRKIYGVRSQKYDDEYGQLHITTIKKTKRLIKKAGFTIKNTSTRFSPINFAKIPMLNEFLTWHVEFLLKKGFK